MDIWDGKSDEPYVEPLTRREREILALLAEGLTTPEIAERLTLATSTVKTHLQHVYSKLGVNKKRQAVLRARELGLLGTSISGGLIPFQGSDPISVSVAVHSEPLTPYCAQPEPKHNLPLQLSSFIGREREMAEIAKLLATARLVTVTGPGGSGKTRLSLQVASELLDTFSDGAWLIEFASLADPALVPQLALTALDMQSESTRLPETSLIEYFRDRKALLILDNCEHLVEACARFVEALLRACPDLRFLVTSRETLAINGENVYRVPPLPFPTQEFPTPKEVLQSDAGRLFIERSSIVLPGFTATPGNAASIAQVCRRLDGIPLAIELAAARSNLLTVEQIAERLDDRFRLLTGGSRTALSRYRMLRATLDWSYELLSEEERRLFCRLSVFSGGWTLEAAEFIYSDRLERGEIGSPSLASTILDLLNSLFNKSMVLAKRVQGESARFHMLETILEYGREKLVESGEEQLFRTRHRDWFLELADGIERGLRGPSQNVWLNRLESEHDNLRAALEWSFEQNEAQPMLRLASSMHDFWFASGYAAEGIRWLKAALSLAEQAEAWEEGHLQKRSLWRAKALASFGSLLVETEEDYSTAQSALEEAISIFRENEDWAGLAFARYRMAVKAFHEGDLEAARPLFEETLVDARKAEDGWIEGRCLLLLAHTASQQGDRAKERQYSEASLTVFNEIGDQWEASNSAGSLAWILWIEGETTKAYELLEKILSNYQEMSSGEEKTNVLNTLAWMTGQKGEFNKAFSLVGESLFIARKQKNVEILAYSVFLSGMLNYWQDNLEEARGQLEESLDIFRRYIDFGMMTASLELLGKVSYSQGDIHKAVALLEESMSIANFGPESNANKLMGLGDAVRAQGDIERAEECYRQSLVYRAGLGSLLAIPPCLEAFAKIASLRHNYRRSACLFGAAQSGRERFGTPLPPVDRGDYERRLTAVRMGLGPEEFSSALQVGIEMSLARAIEYALAEG